MRCRTICAIGEDGDLSVRIPSSGSDSIRSFIFNAVLNQWPLDLERLHDAPPVVEVNADHGLVSLRVAIVLVLILLVTPMNMICQSTVSAGGPSCTTINLRSEGMPLLSKLTPTSPSLIRKDT